MILCIKNYGFFLRTERLAVTQQFDSDAVGLLAYKIAGVPDLFNRNLSMLFPYSIQVFIGVDFICRNSRNCDPLVVFVLCFVHSIFPFQEEVVFIKPRLGHTGIGSISRCHTS